MQVWGLNVLTAERTVSMDDVTRRIGASSLSARTTIRAVWPQSENSTTSKVSCNSEESVLCKRYFNFSARIRKCFDTGYNQGARRPGRRTRGILA